MFAPSLLLRTALIALVVVASTTPALAFKRTFKGEELKDFTLDTLAQTPMRLMEGLGDKATVLIFWASWSPRSAEALGEFQEIFAEHQGAGLQVVAVNVEQQELDPEKRRSIATFATTKGLTYPVLVDDGLQVFNEYGVIAVPSLILADAGGEILDLLEGYSNMTRCDFRDRVLEVLGLLHPTVEEAPEVSAYCPVGKAARYYQMGELFLRKKMAGRAAKALRRAVKEDPKYAEAYVRLAAALDLKGETGAATEARETAAALGMAEPPPEAALLDGEGPGALGAVGSSSPTRTPVSPAEKPLVEQSRESPPAGEEKQ